MFWHRLLQGIENSPLLSVWAQIRAYIGSRWACGTCMPKSQVGAHGLSNDGNKRNGWLQTRASSSRSSGKRLLDGFVPCDFKKQEVRERVDKVVSGLLECIRIKNRLHPSFSCRPCLTLLRWSVIKRVSFCGTFYQALPSFFFTLLRSDNTRLVFLWHRLIFRETFAKGTLNKGDVFLSRKWNMPCGFKEVGVHFESTLVSLTHAWRTRCLKKFLKVKSDGQTRLPREASHNDVYESVERSCRRACKGWTRIQ